MSSILTIFHGHPGLFLRLCGFISCCTEGLSKGLGAPCIKGYSSVSSFSSGYPSQFSLTSHPPPQDVSWGKLCARELFSFDNEWIFPPHLGGNIDGPQA